MTPVSNDDNDEMTLFYYYCFDSDGEEFLKYPSVCPLRGKFSVFTKITFLT
jgi:hypothetical protein